MDHLRHVPEYNKYYIMLLHQVQYQEGRSAVMSSRLFFIGHKIQCFFDHFILKWFAARTLRQSVPHLRRLLAALCPYLWLCAFF